MQGYAQRMVNPNGFSQYAQPAQGGSVPLPQEQDELMDGVLGDYLMRQQMMQAKQQQGGMDPMAMMSGMGGGMSGGMMGGGGEGGGFAGIGDGEKGFGGAVQGGMSGAKMGSYFGPYGTVIGGGLGALLGGFT